MAAAAEEKTESAGSSGGASSGGGSSKLVLILTGVNLLATLGMVAILFISFKKDSSHSTVDDISADAGAHGEAAAGGEHGEAKKDEHGNPVPAAGAKSSQFGRMVTLEQFTVNLSTPGSVNPKFVRVNISLEVPTEDAEAEVNTKMPQVRNAIIDLFNSKRSNDLATAEGRDYLKEEIRNALNGFLINGKVRGVYFTNFALSS